MNPSEVGESFAFDFAEVQPEDYLVENYINEEAVFPPTLWAKLSDSLESSKNACEFFNATFNFQTDAYIKIQSLGETSTIRDQAVRRRRQCIGRKIEEYKN